MARPAQWFPISIQRIGGGAKAGFNGFQSKSRGAVATMKIKLLVDIVFEYGGIRKTKFKAGTVFESAQAFKWITDPNTNRPVETTEVDGYWIGDERMPPVPLLENPGTLIRTKCSVKECSVVE